MKLGIVGFPFSMVYHNLWEQEQFLALGVA